MKSVGIITFHRAINYGAVLQVYALQKSLQKMGVNCEIIDYRCDVIEEQYKPYTFEGNNLPKSIIKNIIYGRVKSKKRDSFYNFIKKNMVLSNEIYNKTTLDDVNNKYDIYITGSDQVWNDACVNLDSAYFLEFVKDSSKKNSYAASFSFNEIPQNLKSEYYKLLNDFNYISTREQIGVDIIEDLLGRKAEVNLDPTLLLTENEWEDICLESKEHGKYILIYTVLEPANITKVAQNLASESGHKVIYLNNEIKMKFDKDGFQNIKAASPEEFITLFKNASYVLTNSFHGTVFSIIFKKQFWVELENKHGRNTRSENLLNLLDLTEREHPENINSEINWDKVDRKINIQRNNSLEYLKTLTI